MNVTIVRVLALFLFAPVCGSFAVGAFAEVEKSVSRNLPQARQNVPYATSLTSRPVGTRLHWEIAEGSLPKGLALNTATGEIKGTPLAAGNSAFVVKVGNTSNKVVAVGSLSLTVTSPVTIDSSVVAAAVVNHAYTQTLKASGGTAGGYSWSLVSGALPAHVLLLPNGVLSGLPTSPGTYRFVVQAAQGGWYPSAARSTLTLTVEEPVVISNGVLRNAIATQPYQGQLTAQGGSGNLSWAVTAGSLPAGLQLTAAGTIQGAATTVGGFLFTATVTDANGFSASVHSTITVLSPLKITNSLPAATKGTAYAARLSASGGNPAYTWSVAAGSLPAGLTLAATTGVVSGVPVNSGTTAVTMAVKDSGLPAQQTTLAATISVAQPVPPTAANATWYVRPDGGTRYSSRVPLGQCDGTADVAYAGIGVNQHCAFNDVRYLWQDGAYSTGDSFPAWGWVGKGGDTYLLRGSIATGAGYRVGWPNQNGSCVGEACFGLAGDPYNSGPPAPPSGTADAHTRILGENYASCHAPSARTQLHGGFGVGSVLNMRGASYVDVACLDVTDYSACTTANTLCNRTVGTLDDYASNGISWYRTSTHDTLTDVRIHGIAGAGMNGPTGDGVVMTYLDIVGNGYAGWNADPGDGTTGTGSLLIQNFSISWNGCSEQYPLVDKLPYDKCHDDGSGGYGDGFGTTTVASNPGWAVTFDQGVVSYNTQDGLDALHLQGTGSSMTISRVNAYGNMGQQLKVGGAAGSIVNSLITGNCSAMAHPIPGTPAGYNANLGDFCRAADSAVLLTVGNGAMTHYDFNTLYTANATGINIGCDQTNGACNASALMDFRNNVFVGFTNNAANGYNPGNGDNSNPIYQGAGINPLLSPGSFYTNNATFHPKSNWTCADEGEKNALCVDPALMNEAYPGYGFDDAALSKSSPLKGAGVAIPAILTDFLGVLRGAAPSIGAMQ